MHEDAPFDARAAGDVGLVASHPPAALAVVATSNLQTLADLAVLRHELLGWLAPAGAAASARVVGAAAEKMVIVASELASNALRHGRAPTVVRLLRDGRSLCLDVADHSPATPPFLAGRRAPGDGGFGLLITRRLAQRVGWYPSPPSKHVWALFVAPA